MDQRGNLSKYSSLRKKFPEFVYDSFNLSASDKGIRMDFVFRAGEKYTFTPYIIFHGKQFSNDFLHDAAARSMAFHIGMVEMISYWKAFCSPQILIRPCMLNNDQQQWWKKLFIHGLGEFFHTNGIPVPGDELLAFRFEPGTQALPPPSHHEADGSKAVIPVGGGKDSAVSIALLKKINLDCHALELNSRPAIQRVIKTGGFSAGQVITIDRHLDPELLKLNRQGFLNGHTPFSALLAFVSVFAARASQIGHIVLSNESSASDPNIPGTKINHQYSKSLEFEQDFRNYLSRFIDDGINYFSLLRPLNELQIGALFARMKQFHKAFRSCNAGSKTDAWCCQCPKCLFTHVILAPFLSEKSLKTIFGMDLFEELSLVPLLDQLSGQAHNKPFECVGTIGEVNAALVYMVKKFERNGKTPPALIRHYAATDAYASHQNTNIHDLLHSLPDEGFLEGPFRTLLSEAIKTLNTAR